MKFWLIGGSVFVAAIGAGLALAMQHPGVACAQLPAEAGPVYADGPVPPAVVERIEHHAERAAARIEATFGAPRSRPRILVVADAEAAAAWGANGTASMHRAPWGSCIVLGPEGRSVDVIAHEWLHAEIQHRVGFWRFLREMPTWFDEGAALLVDHREPYRPGNIDLPEHSIEAMRDLDRGSEFFAGDVRTHYQAARLAVEPLIRAETFFDDLERVGAGEPFDEVFGR